MISPGRRIRLVERICGAWRCKGVPDDMTDQREARAMNKAAAGDAFRTCESLATALSAGETSSRELVDLYLNRIQALDGKLHAFVSVFEREARLAAEARDKARAAHPVGPLHGIPVAIKDLFDYAGHRTGAGSKAWTPAPAEETAFAVQRLEAAGMIVLGQDADGRVRLWRLGDESGDGHALESLGSRGPSGTRRVVERLGGRRGGRARAGGARQRHGRLGEDPRLLLRPRRAQDLAGRHRSRRGVSSVALSRHASVRSPDRSGTRPSSSMRWRVSTGATRKPAAAGA